MWAGPVGNWIAALERIERLGLQVVVGGHGPLGASPRCAPCATTGPGSREPGRGAGPEEGSAELAERLDPLEPSSRPVGEVAQPRADARQRRPHRRHAEAAAQRDRHRRADQADRRDGRAGRAARSAGAGRRRHRLRARFARAECRRSPPPDRAVGVRRLPRSTSGARLGKGGARPQDSTRPPFARGHGDHPAAVAPRGRRCRCRTSIRESSARRTIPISSIAKLAPRQRRRPPPKGIQV